MELNWTAIKWAYPPEGSRVLWLSKEGEYLISLMVRIGNDMLVELAEREWRPIQFFTHWMPLPPSPAKEECTTSEEHDDQA
jgi:hypothetical protein